MYVFISTCLRDETSCNCLFECVSYASQFYKNIFIIDDTPETGVNIYQMTFPVKVTIIKNEFKKSGELTRIWYFWKYCKSGDIGILIHDSTFINSFIPVLKKDFVPLFSFIHKWDDVEYEKSFIIQYPSLYKLYEAKRLWDGCFGVQYELTWDFVNRVMEKYLPLFKDLLNTVKTRRARSCMERVVQVIFHDVSNNTESSIYGTIHDFTTKYWGKPWGIDYSKFRTNRKKCERIPIIKVWVGR